MRVKIILLSIILLMFVVACQSMNRDVFATSMVEPPSRKTPVWPIELSESEVVAQTIEAFLNGDRLFWEKVVVTAFPILHPSFESEEIFVDQVSGYSEYFDLRCEGVYTYSGLAGSDWFGHDIVTLVFSGDPIAGEGEFASSQFSNTVHIIEIKYVSEKGNLSSYYFGDIGYFTFEDETIQEKFEAYLDMRQKTLSKYDQELTIEPCP